MNYSKSFVILLIVFFATISNAQTAADKSFEAYLVGRSYLLENDYVRAAEAFNRSILLKPSPNAYKGLGMAYHHLDKYSQALAALTQAVQGAPQDPEVHYWLAWAYESIGIDGLNAGSTDAAMFRKAEVEAREALRLKPNYQLAHWVLADSLYKQAKYPESVSAAERALALRLDDQATMYLLALGYARLGRKSEAMELYNKLVPLDPKYAASLLSRLNEISNAARSNSTSPATRGSAENYLNEGVSHYKLQQYPLALPAFQQAVRLDPNNSANHFWLGATYYWLKRYQPALTSIQESIRLRPNEPMSHLWLGDVYADGFNQYDKAITEYQESIRLDPKNGSVHSKLGVAFIEIDELESAVSAFQSAIKLEPTDAGYYKNLGYTYLWLGRREDAVLVQQKLLTLDQTKAKELGRSIEATLPADHDKPGFLYVLGVIARDRSTTALAIYRRILLLSTKPDEKAGAYRGMGAAYRAKGNESKAIAAYQQALPIYQRLVQLQPNEGYLLSGLARTLVGLGKRDQAIPIYKKLQTIAPDYAKEVLNELNK